MLTAGVHGPTGSAALDDCLISAHYGPTGTAKFAVTQVSTNRRRPWSYRACRVRCLSYICTPQVSRRGPTGLPSSWTTGQQCLALTASSPFTDRNQIPTWTAKLVRQRARWSLGSATGTTVFAYRKCPRSCRGCRAVLASRVWH